MKKLVHCIDEQGYYLYSKEVNAHDVLPANDIDTSIPAGIFQPFKWTSTEWVSELSQAEIDQIMNNIPDPMPSYEEVLQENNLLKERLSNSEDAILFIMDYL